MRLINAAYEVLSDPERRKEHDQWIADQRKAKASKAPPHDAPKSGATPKPEPRSTATFTDNERTPGSASMNHEWAWTASLVPLIALVAESLLPPVEWYWLYTYLSIGAYVLFCSLDELYLKKAGLKPPNAFWVFLVPVYLWQRDSLFGKWRPRFLVWVGAVVLAAMFDSNQYTIGAEMSGVWASEQLGTVEFVLGTDPKTMTIESESMRVKFLNTERNHATYEFVSGPWAGRKVTVRRIWLADDGFTLELIFFDDPELTYALGFVRPN